MEYMEDRFNKEIITGISKRRSENDMICDVTEILNTSIKGVNLSKRAKYAMLNDMAWEWTEMHGKYYGCRYWSERALEIQEANKQDTNYNYSNVCTHEHVVPKSMLINYLLSLDGSDSADQSFIGHILHDALFAVIVTKDEDKKLNKFRQTMPSHLGSDFSKYTKKDFWARYKDIDTDINVYCVEWEKKQIISKLKILLVL